jgi:signal recognition particle receptor subunit beta
MNRAAREIDCKIVYYGPASSGKTTNLQYVHGRLDPSTRGQLIAPTVDGDRTLLFDFLAVEMGSVGGYRTRLHLYTVPGQVRSSDTRRLVLQGVDGIVFVADSHQRRLEDNVESLTDLDAGLASHDIPIADIPCVIQYNKRDLAGALPVDQLEASLNPGGLTSFEAVATDGTGVLESLTAISRQVITSLSLTPHP